MDELLAAAERVDAQPHTGRRAVGLGAALVATAATVAFIVTGTAYGLFVAFGAFAMSVWQP